MSLRSLPQLKSLFINLHQEDQVDLIMRTLTDLEFLNGLKVEREILEEEGEYEDEDQTQGENQQPRKSRSPVKEEPMLEDLEDEDSYMQRQQELTTQKS
jgi:hypothetical protein